MKITDKITSDYRIPHEYIVPLMDHLEIPCNELGDRFWGQTGQKDHAADAVAWWEEVSTSDQMLLSQVLASIAAPVMVWECSGNLFSSRIAPVYGIIPDCDDLIAPLVLWEEEDGSSLCVLRIDDRSALLDHITGILIPAQNNAETIISCSLSAEDLFVFCTIIDAVRKATFTSYLSHDTVPDYISNEQILSLVKDQEYLLDTRWALPTLLKVTQRWPGDWAGTSMWKHIDALKRMNLVSENGDEKHYTLTDEGKKIQQAFLFAITSLCSRISSLNETGIKTDQYLWTIHSGICNLLVDLGKFPVQTVTIRSVEPQDLRNRLDIMIRPVTTPPFIEHCQREHADD